MGVDMPTVAGLASFPNAAKRIRSLRHPSTTSPDRVEARQDEFKVKVAEKEEAASSDWFGGG
jgi:hypothetical protein